MPQRIKAVLKAKGGPTRYQQGVPIKVAGERSYDMGVDGIFSPLFSHSFSLFVIHVHPIFPIFVSFTDALLYYWTRRWLIIILLLVLQAGGSDEKASQGHEEKH